MATETLDRPRTRDPGSGLGGNWLVIVLNDDHNTFDHVAKSLARVIPGVTVDGGCRFAERMLTAVQTLRLRGRNVLDYLTRAVAAFRAGQPAPSLLA